MKKISLTKWHLILGFLTLIATVAVPVMLLQPDPSKVATAQKLIDDLERIKVIAPSNADLADCLKTSGKDNFDEKYEDCFKRIKQDQEEARSLLERNKSSLGTFFGDRLLVSVAPNIDGLDYLLYEMGNNQYVLQRWREDGCPEKIDFIPANEVTDERFLKTKDGKVRCALVVQGSETFLKNQASDCNQDCLSALRKRFIPKEDAEYAIVPGSSILLNEYFLGLNNNLYSLMLGDIDELLKKVRSEL